VRKVSSFCLRVMVLAVVLCGLVLEGPLEAENDCFFMLMDW